MDKDKLLKSLKNIEHLHCMCHVLKAFNIRHSGEELYYPLWNTIKELEKDGEIRLSMGSPERCCGITILKTESD